MERLLIFIALIGLSNFKSIGQCTNDSLYPIRVNKLYGFCDKTGKAIIPPIYAYVYPFYDGVARVTDTLDIDSYINISGKVIYKYPDNQKDIYHNFSEGLLAVFDTLKQKWGYINTKGNWHIKPKFSIARDFNCGRAIVCTNLNIHSDGGFCGTKLAHPIYYIIKRNGQEVNRNWGYRRISDFIEGYAFIDDTLAINVKGKVIKNSSIDNDLVLDRQFEYNYTFKRFLRDEKGMELNFDDYYLQEKLFYYYNYKTQKFGLTNRRGEKLTEDVFDEISRYSSGVVAFKTNKKWGLIDSNAKIIIEPSFDFISNFKEGFAYAKSNNKYGIINTKGEFVIQPKYDVTYEYKSLQGVYTIFPFILNGKYILIDLKENIIWKED